MKKPIRLSLVLDKLFNVFRLGASSPLIQQVPSIDHPIGKEMPDIPGVFLSFLS